MQCAGILSRWKVQATSWALDERGCPQGASADLELRLVAADPLQRIHLIQERRNLERRIEGASAEAEDDLPALEKAFIAVAADYGSRKGIDYATWREAGVTADVLQKAGIHWSRRS